MILYAGAVLLTPGFFTDAFGFALLTPPFRAAVYNYLRKRISVQSFEMGQGARHQRPPHSSSPHDTVIDGDFHEVDPAKKPTHSPSEWTKH
jgi:UPF0716 protein FxsA